MAASGFYESVREGTAEEHKLCFTETARRAWRPSVLRQLPWTGLLALILGFGCGAAALAIALVSDGKALDYWNVYSYSLQPTVLLAILITFANALLGYAFASGIAIFWWLSALAGRTLRQLHASQSRGTSLIALLTLRPVFNAVTVASVFTILLLMDQPLFQRGIRVITQSSEESKVLTIPISSSPIQEGATGIIPGYSSYREPELFHPLFAEVVRQYQSREPIHLALPGCKGRCDLDVISTGWEVECNNWETIDQRASLSDYEEMHASNGDYKGPEMMQPAFSVEITYDPGAHDSSLRAFAIHTSVMYKATPGVNGITRWRNCTLTEALIRYPVEINNDILRLKAMPLGTSRTTQRILRKLEFTVGADHPLTLGGIWRALHYQFTAHANISFDEQNVSIRTKDLASNTYLRVPENATLDNIDYTVTWSDPTDDIISMAHELTLRIAIATTNTLVVTGSTNWWVGPASTLLTQGQSEIGYPDLALVNRTTSQDAEVNMTFDEAVYEIQPQWLAWAFALISLATLAVLSTYWGWWHLGRPVSMSPLEIAKAFDAPLMRHADPNGSVEDHLKISGDTLVRYGFHATITEQPETDNQRASIQARIDSSLDTPMTESPPSDYRELRGPSTVNESAPDTPMAGQTRRNDDIELQMLRPGAKAASDTQANHEASGVCLLSSRTTRSASETHVDSVSDRALEAGPASSYVHARIEIRLRFAEERHSMGD